MTKFSTSQAAALERIVSDLGSELLAVPPETDRGDDWENERAAGAEFLAHSPTDGRLVLFVRIAGKPRRLFGWRSGAGSVRRAQCDIDRSGRVVLLVCWPADASGDELLRTQPECWRIVSGEDFYEVSPTRIARELVKRTADDRACT